MQDKRPISVRVRPCSDSCDVAFPCSRILVSVIVL